MKYIKLKKKKNRIYFYFNNIELGCAWKEVDGFYIFNFNPGNSGCWSSYVLREIADILDALNKEWSNQINKDIK